MIVHVVTRRIWNIVSKCSRAWNVFVAHLKIYYHDYGSPFLVVCFFFVFFRGGVGVQSDYKFAY